MVANIQGFKALFNLIETLSKQSESAAIQEVMEAIAHYQPQPLECDKLLRALARQIGAGIKVVRQEYNMTLKKLNLVPLDLGFIIAQTTLDTFYGKKSLKRYPDGNFYVYDKTHWRMTTQDQVRSYIQQIAGEYLIQAEDKVSLKSLVNDAYASLCDFLGTDEDVLNFEDGPPPVLNFLNGELWIAADGSMELRSHKPESRLFHCLPYIYDPKAKAPLYEQAMLDIFAEATHPADMCRHWYEFFGLGIQPWRPTPCFFMMIGHGRNGKSVNLKTIQKALGPDAVLNDNLATFQKDRFNVAALHGKLLFVDDDINTKVVLADGMIKKLSEPKTLSARHPYGRKKFSFKSVALPVIAGNHYPGCDDLSEGMLRRINIIPFKRQFTEEEADLKLFETIWAQEMPGVINLALAGLQRLIKRGHFNPPEDCMIAMNEFLAHSNPLWCFIDECLEADPKGRIKFPDFRSYFECWVSKQGFSKQPILDKTLRRKLEGLGFETVKNQGAWAIKGFCLKTS